MQFLAVAVEPATSGVGKAKLDVGIAHPLNF
jgi:hypothetical protein